MTGRTGPPGGSGGRHRELVRRPLAGRRGTDVAGRRGTDVADHGEDWA
ncbi:hypothetical protein [Micromonospora sp. NPDC092111]